MSRRHSPPSGRVLIAAFSLPVTVEMRTGREDAAQSPPPAPLTASQELLATALSTRLQHALRQQEPAYADSQRATFSQRERVNMSELMAEATSVEPKFLSVPHGTTNSISSPPSPAPLDPDASGVRSAHAPSEQHSTHTTSSLVDHGRDAPAPSLSLRESGSGAQGAPSMLRAPLAQHSRPTSRPPSPPPRGSNAPLSIISDLTAKQDARTRTGSPNVDLFREKRAQSPPAAPHAPLLPRPRPVRPRGVRRPTLSGADLPKGSPFVFAPHPTANYGLVNAVASVPDDCFDGGKLYIGTLGPGSGPPEVREQTEARARAECDCLPVWVDEHDYTLSYSHYCKQILWPTFHATLPTITGLEKEHDSFRSYVEVNRRFADRIADEYREGDVIWVHDYHLLLVPQMVRERLPRAAIGFFLHIAFPSSELFRCLGMRELLLCGMLGADFIGFQTHNFCRHFKQTVGRILQLETTPRGVHHDGTFTTVSPCPIGIDVSALNARRCEPEVFEWVQRLAERFADKYVIIGRDKLDWIKGVRHKLRGFELFLDENPSWVGRVVLVQVALATVQDASEMGETTAIVTRINNKYGSLTYQPVVFLHVQEITFGQYLALLSVADAFLAMSLREGMNLTTHEYVICQESKKRPLILSEFTGTYSTLRACIGVNPWDTRQVANAINCALTMEPDEMHARWTDLYGTVVAQSAQFWVTSVLSQLQRAYLSQPHVTSLFTPRLVAAQMVSEWRAACSRLVVVDLEQTLVLQDALHVHEHGFVPPAEIIALLQALVEDDKNYVYVLSGKSCRELDQIAERINRIGLVAENGCYVRHCLSPEWTSLVSGFSLAWKEHVIEIMRYYTERTPGSWIETRRASITWRFAVDAASPTARMDHRWALRQAAEMRSLIYDSIGERFSLRILVGVNSFVIMPKNVSRATAVQHIVGLDSMGMLPALAPATASVGSCAKNILDFALAISQDDALLRYVNQLDMTYVPRTCTTAASRTQSAPQAAYQLAPGTDVVRALQDLIALRQSDLRWGGPVMVDI